MTKTVFIYKYYSLNILAVQYDKQNNSWGTLLNLLKKDILEASSKALKTFGKFEKMSKKGIFTDNWNSNNWDKWIHQNKLADDQLIKFLKDTEYSEKTLANYQIFLEQNGESTSKFSQITAKADGIVKSFGATLASMAVMWVVGEAINFAASAIDNYIHRFEKAQEAMKNANNAFKESEDKVKN